MKLQLYIDTSLTTIRVKNRLFLIENQTNSKQISPKRIDSIAITSNVQLNTAAIKLAAKNDISIFIYDHLGNSVGQFRSPSFTKHNELRTKQLIFMNQPEGKIWVKEQLYLKTKAQITSINRWIKEFSNCREDLTILKKDIEKYLIKIHKVDLQSFSINETLMGLEGSIARQYYKAVNIILPSKYKFAKRSRRPGEDYYNTTINYLYGMTYSEVTKAVQAAGLNPYCGTLHKVKYGETLVFDFIEPFRPIVDRLLIKLCLENTLENNHFTPIKNGYQLNRKGKKIILPAYAAYMQKRIKWQNRVASIRNHLFTHARNLKLTIENNVKDVSNFL